ncbi:MAG: hypothetical protein WCY32_11705, partial [Burkholderiaceae bacterium]
RLRGVRTAQQDGSDQLPEMLRVHVTPHCRAAKAGWVTAFCHTQDMHHFQKLPTIQLLAQIIRKSSPESSDGM